MSATLTADAVRPIEPPAVAPSPPAPPAAHQPRWVIPVLAAMALAALGLYVWGLDRIGFANTYYSAAVLAATRSWKAFFFGSFDANSFITVDKPPVALWVMAVSGRIFGVNSWSLLLPEAMMGVASVLLVYHIVQRWFGYSAGLIAATVMLVTPVATAMFRYNNPDALLTLLLVLAAVALQRAIESGQTRWIVASAATIGFAFNTKYLAAYIVLPAFAAVFLLAAPGGLGRRAIQLVVAGTVLIVSSAWWLVVVDLIPAASRPYIAGSTNNSVLNLVLGYDGFGRITGAERAGGPGRTPPGGGLGAAFGGGPSPMRLFNDQIASQISWLIPLAVVTFMAGLWLRRRAPRTDLRRAGYLLFGGWLLTHAVVFSAASGIFHPYYTIAMAPALAGLVGAGVTALLSAGRRSLVVRVVLGATLAATAYWCARVLGRTPGFLPGLGLAITIAASAGALALIVGGSRRRWAIAAAGVAVAAVLSAPAAYAIDTVARTGGGGDPTAGPGGIQRVLPPGLGGRNNLDGAPGGVGGPPVGAGLGDGSAAVLRNGAGLGFRRDVAQANPALVRYLTAHRGTASWIVATTSAMQGAPIELATGEPVMDMGGFMGTDPAPTLPELQAFISSGQLRYVLSGGFERFGPSAGAARSTSAPPPAQVPGQPRSIALPAQRSVSNATVARLAWVSDHCTPVTPAQLRPTGGAQLYDCGQADVPSG